jgi:uncharacterized protein
MALTPSPDPAALSADERRILLSTAREAIRRGCEGKPARPEGAPVPEGRLAERRATFVTLEKRGQLRGCIGMLEAVRPLLVDVAENARAAAFEDPRFPPVAPEELDDLDIYLSILTPPEEISFASEADLLRQIVPGEDGLILQEGPRRGTFLPSVWEQLPDRRAFLDHLKMKAGLPPGYWSDTLRCFRYRAHIVGS